MPDSILLDPPTPKPADTGTGGHDHGHDDSGGGGGNFGGDDGAALPVGNARFIMILGLIASSMLFSGLVGAFVVLRGATPVWPPAGTPPLPPLLWVNSVLVVASSLALAFAHVAQRRGRAGPFRLGTLLAAALAAAFLLLQLRFWHELTAAGFRPETNTYAGNFYLLTYVHFGHVVVALAALLLLALRALAGAAPQRLSVATDVTAMLWHFVGAAWLVIWSLLVG